MQRIAVIAKLRPGAAEEAAKLIELGPPFDPSVHEIERHTVFLGPDVAVFSFEGGKCRASSPHSEARTSSRCSQSGSRSSTARR